MSSNGHPAFPTGATLLAGGVLSIVVFTGFALVGTPPIEVASDPAATQPLATPMPGSGGVERFDHAGIPPADPTEQDVPGLSIAAYGP